METRLTLKFNDLVAALKNFQGSLDIDTTSLPEIVQDSIWSGQMQKFEFSLEILWKVVKLVLYEIEGVDVATPKAVAKHFFDAGYCGYSDYELFVTMINDRNQLSHVYRREMADGIRMRLPEYLDLMERIVESIKPKV